MTSRRPRPSPCDWEIAPALAAAGADVEWCEEVARGLPGAALGPAMEWVGASLANAALLREVKEATRRISTLVAAVRSYSQMDRASLQTTDLVEGLDSTLVMLAHKLGDRIQVQKRYAPGLPPIEAMAGELNQVWTNLADREDELSGWLVDHEVDRRRWRCPPEASVYPDLAAIVTAAVMGMMFYFGPWADPPGMDELWWLLTTAAVILASWRWWGKPTSYLITRVSIIIAAFPGV